MPEIDVVIVADEFCGWQPRIKRLNDCEDSLGELAKKHVFQDATASGMVTLQTSSTAGQQAPNS